jgi:micrococcal nuclease
MKIITSSRNNRRASALLLMILLLFAAPTLAQSNKSVESLPGFQAEVIQIVKGDTIKVRRPGKHEIETVKFIGLDAPEASLRDKEGQEPYGTFSLQYLSLAITRKMVRVEQDVQLQNAVGEILAYVWLGDRLMNEEMLKNGLAMLATTPPNVKYVERFQQAQVSARAQKQGIWNPAAPLTQTPSEFRAAKRQAVAEQAEKEASLEIAEFVPGCVIGNRVSRKYHLPTGRFYEQAKKSKNHVFFKSAADAEKAGYVPSAR